MATNWRSLVSLVSLLLICHTTSTGAFPRPGLDQGGSWMRWNVHCRDGLEYHNGHMCCLNCPAGTRVMSPCTRAGEKGQCEECDYGTYAEHAGGLRQCFKCTQCRSDEEMVRACTHTHNTECRCRPGRFCAPDQPCEVCKRCSRCEPDEKIVRNCTSTANTQCKKVQPRPASPSAAASVVVPLVLSLFAVVVIIVGVVLWRCRTEAGSRRGRRGGVKAGQRSSDHCPTEGKKDGEPQVSGRPSLILSQLLVRAKPSAGTEDECKGLCQSLNSSASNSQHSLTGPPCSAFPASPPRASPVAPSRREDEPFPKLVPVNGVESLRKCFEYFEETDVDIYKRFFRHLGISDNVIKSKDPLPFEDRIHELLNIWVEKEGRDASLNDLLKALLDLNQRRTAETIKESAVHSGQYFCCDD
ncbi:tumor necrosis factor receptor superfamily member 10B-like isoform X2 [Pempheris klunzingeri]|uniref:tumor necrosis factor receptor superfamily member 10B-like isoform X2 n=1 Tax=Pempheris klunzingeri TaxID=3127111 RepID=UPI00397EBF27